MSPLWVLVLSSLVLSLVYAILILYNTPWRKVLAAPGTGPEIQGNEPGLVEKSQEPGQEKRISVVVPYRNEASNLPGLLDALADQSLDRGSWEVLFVDDHSTDRPEATAPGFRFFSLPENESGKKAALAMGVAKARFEWILQLDADCLPGPDFLRSHFELLGNAPADLVAGAVVPKRTAGTVQAFERLDVLALTGISMGSFQRGRALMCSGANLLYCRELYEATRSLDPGLASGDDMFLMMAARKQGKRLVFNTDPRSVVRTDPAGSLSALLRQRMRWGGKTKAYPLRGIKLFALVVFLSALSLCLLPFLLFSSGTFWMPFLLAPGLKALADLVVLERSARILRLGGVPWYFPLAFLFYQPYIVITALGGLLGAGSWKGRRGP